MSALLQQIKEQAQAIANQAQAIADGKIPESGLHGHAALVLQNAKVLHAWASKRVTPTEEEIEAARTPQGGWDRDQLAKWGVPWPPPAGWKEALKKRSTT